METFPFNGAFLLLDLRLLSFDSQFLLDCAGPLITIRRSQDCPLVLLRIVTAGRLCLANRAEVLTRRAVVVAIAGAATDSETIHVTTGVRRVRSWVRAGAIRVMSHGLYGRAASWRRRVGTLHGSVRRLLRRCVLWCALHAITLGR